MKKLLFLLMIYSSNIFACQDYLDDYNSDKRTAREISQATPIIAGGFSWLGPVVSLVASGFTSLSASLYDDRAECNLKKYHRCMEERREEAVRLQAEKSRENEQSRSKKLEGGFD